MRVSLVTGLILVCASSVTIANGDIDQLDSLSQDEFRLLSRDLGSVFNEDARTQGQHTRTSGFDFGVDLISTRFQHGDLIDRASSDRFASEVTMPRLHFRKGFGGIDLGAFYSTLPSSNIQLMGAEARYSLLDGNRGTPAIWLRGTVSRSTSIDQLDVDTTGVELSISKGFANFTPYAGWGRVWVKSTPNAGALTEENFSEEKYFLGATLNFGVFNMDLEGDRTGDSTSYSLKFGWRF